MVSWKSCSSAASRYSSYILHIESISSINSLYISRLFPNIFRRKSLNKPQKTAAYIGTGGVPLSCIQWISSKLKVLFLVIRRRDLSIAPTGRYQYFVLLPFKYCDIWFKSGQLQMFVYTLVTSTVSSMVPGGRYIIDSCYFKILETLKQSVISASTSWNLL